MKFRIEVICVSEDGAEQRNEVTAIERQELAMETLGLNLADGKSILEGLQDFVVAQQTAKDLEQRRACPRCGRAHTSKGIGTIDVKTVFGPVELPNPRWNRCPCQPDGPKTFRPMTHWLRGRTCPELLYLETEGGKDLSKMHTDRRINLELAVRKATSALGKPPASIRMITFPPKRSSIG
jgi:hypothetical protein